MREEQLPLQHLEMPNHEAVESHQLTHIPFAPWCRACIAGRCRETPHFRHGGGEETAAATPVVSLDCFFLGLTVPTLVLCDGKHHVQSRLDGSKERYFAICGARCLCFSARVGLHANDPQE